ncbi:hypothetical protein HH214_19880 [Mucilaginibacter robiniae]|uniref:Bacterial surface antigen (D15) domain-containing protein n=1 Tax=Mucilaginibacter robiniae TaxID=2728022 RepID=A0A7L5E805_9SPHI|nr:hypothetical protein [Mucilaginibacter robiniae]QJD97974.1 hypothetical protein HH214_19880 [Mucilaginibacter robiniae]
MFKRSVLLIMGSCLGIGSIQTAYAQAFGGNPPSIKWNQVNTPAARVIFPKGMDSSGQRVANIVQQLNRTMMPTIGYKQKQINIVLQNQLLTTNGYVGLAPFRSEFYLVPAQNNFQLGTLPIADQLAIHEFRHVQQFNNYDVGLTRILHVLFGEGGQQIANSFSIPNWFDEGDAVYNETLMSNQGRGRLPYFFNGYRAIWAAGKNYNWMKLRNGSYQDYVPDWYPTGYMLTAYGRQKFGAQVWKGVTHDAATFKHLFYPFQTSFKQHTKQEYSSFRGEALNYFKQQLVTPNMQKAAEAYKPNQHFIATTEYPAYVDDSTLIYQKTSYKHRPAFIIRRGNREKVIRLADINADNYFNYNNGQIVYVARRPDVRWGYREYNDIKLIDVKTGNQRRVTARTKYFSPALSADNKTIVAVHVPPSGAYELHIIDVASGKVLQRVPNVGHYYYTYPKFYNNHQIVSAIRNTAGEMSVALIDLKTGENQYLTAWGMSPKGFTTVHRDTVYFTATSGLNDKLYAVNVPDHQLYELQNDSLHSFVGNYEPAVGKSKIAWVSFSAYGYQIHELPKQALQLKAVNTLPKLPEFGINALHQDTSADLLADVQNENLPVKKYSKLHHPFNFHSLIPYLDDPDYTLSLTGNNILNTFQSDLSLTYNRNEGYKQISFTTLYGALYPYLFASASYTFDRRRYFLDQRRNTIEANWNESNVQGGLEFPFNLSRGRNYTNITYLSSLSYTVTDVQSLFSKAIPDNTYLTNAITFSNQVAKPRQNIYPHLAQIITVNYRNTVNSLQAHQLLTSGTFYFPGFLANHSIVVSLAYQQHDRNYSFFSNELSFSRGYTSDNLYRLQKAGINYSFPIAYPDAGFGNIVYLLRLRGNLFYDHTHGRDFYTNGNTFKADFNSAGAELFFDTQWLNENPISFGIRYTRLLNDDLFGNNGRNRITLILPLSIL